MKIERNLGGRSVKIELTAEETEKAFRERARKYFLEESARGGERWRDVLEKFRAECVDCASPPPKRYVKMNAAEMAEHVTSKEFGAVASFALRFDEEKDALLEGDCESWFGVRLIKSFDTTLVLAGEWGGGYNETADITELASEQKGYLTDFLAGYFKEIEADCVAVEITESEEASK